MADVKTWKNRLKCPHLASFSLIALVVIGTLGLTNNNNNVVKIENPALLKEEDHQTVSKNGPIPGCNLFSGKWVYDNVSYPLYKEEQCSVIGYNLTTSCQKHGRKDLKYQKWRWQPHHCEIPRFNGSVLLEKIRGKKLVFVGDSVSRNQWESMVCLIQSHLPPSSLKSWKLQYIKDNFFKYHSSEYNVTIGFYWSPYFVESNCDNAKNHSYIRPRIVRMKSIEKHGRHWIDADILVFGAYAWWTDPRLTILWGSFGSPDAIYKEVEMKLRRYEIALNTWSNWLEININRSKTQIFFMAHSPYHFGETLDNIFYCYNHTEPILEETYWSNSVNRSMMQITESILEKLEQRGLKVEYMNVTQLSGYRIDAHPSIYRDAPFASSYSDCLHWCLPGLPDVWNLILYAYIIKS